MIRLVTSLLVLLFLASFFLLGLYFGFQKSTPQSTLAGGSATGNALEMVQVPPQETQTQEIQTPVAEAPIAALQEGTPSIPANQVDLFQFLKTPNSTPLSSLEEDTTAWVCPLQKPECSKRPIESFESISYLYPGLYSLKSLKADSLQGQTLFQFPCNGFVALQEENMQISFLKGLNSFEIRKALLQDEFNPQDIVFTTSLIYPTACKMLLDTTLNGQLDFWNKQNNTATLLLKIQHSKYLLSCP